MDSLFDLAQKGDRQALDRLVQENLALVHSIAHRFQGRGAEMDDLIQTGSIGLCKAIKNFNEGLGFRFSTYAVWLISGEIRRLLRDSGAIKVSRKLKETANRAVYATEKLRDELGREPTLDEIAIECGAPRDEIIMALDAAREPQSLYEKVGEDGELMDVVPANEDDNIDRIALFAALGGVSESERKLIFYRYFEDKTQNETARLLGTSQVQVSRLEKKVLGKLRGAMLG